MGERSVIIIGAGIAGLAAGCYGQMNGYRTQIFEMGDKPGGLCTSWSRQGYVFDGCIRSLPGSRHGAPFHHIWEELGADPGTHIVNHDEFLRIEDRSGKAVILYTDVDQLERHLKALAPQDTDTITEYTDALRHLARFQLPMEQARELYGVRELFQLLLATAPYIKDLLVYSHTSLPQMVNRFHNPLLREAFSVVANDLAEGPVMALFMLGEDLQNRNAGYPIGGSLSFTSAIARRYESLGGRIHYDSRTVKILVEGDRAVGVRLEDGTERRADLVISAADGHSTLFSMLDGRYLDDTMRGYYEELPVCTPYAQVSLGVARDLSAEPHAVNFPLTRPLLVGSELHSRMEVRHYGFDPSLAPPGKSSVIVLLPTHYDVWKALAHDWPTYQGEKRRLLLSVIAALEQRFPGIDEQVEVADVATPLTYERRTGNWCGSPKGWQVSTKTLDLLMSRKGIRRTLFGLSNFYMAGHWVEPVGGVATAAFSGRSVVQILCHEDGREFMATKPQTGIK